MTTTEETIRIECKCGQSIEAPAEMVNELVQCPSCGEPVLVEKKRTAQEIAEFEARKKQREKELSADRTVSQARPRPMEHMLLRESAQTAANASAFCFVVGGLVGLVAIWAAMNDAAQGAAVFGGLCGALFSLGIMAAFFKHLILIRASLEEANWFKRQEMTTRTEVKMP